MDTASQIALALLPFAVLLAGFLALGMGALKLSLYVWILEFFIVLFFYDMPASKALAASAWGNITIWNGFLVLWTGQIFGQCFRTTGALAVLLGTLDRILPTKAGKAVTLCSVVGGYLGAFNGFATYPVTIPGLVKQGVDGFRAAVGYLVYFSWSVAFVSLFIGATVASTVTKLPVADIAQTMGLLTIPLVFVSVYGFFKILGFSLRDRENRKIAGLTIAANVLAIVLFTQLFPSLYILTLIAAASLSFVALWLLGRTYDRSAFGDMPEAFAPATVLRAFLPLILGSVIVLLFTYPLKSAVGQAAFRLSLWGYAPVAINLLNTPGTYILFTAMFCYVFAVQKSSSFLADLKAASKRSGASLATLLLGGAMVNLMLDTGQIALLAKELSQWGSQAYGLLLSGLGFLAGMAFGQGIPACAMFAKMQLSAAAHLARDPALLVGIAAMITMGPANPLKPSLLKFTSSLANIQGRDSDMFNLAFRWQIAQLILIGILVCWLL